MQENNKYESRRDPRTIESFQALVENGKEITPVGICAYEFYRIIHKIYWEHFRVVIYSTLCCDWSDELRYFINIIPGSNTIGHANYNICKIIFDELDGPSVTLKTNFNGTHYFDDFEINHPDFINDLLLATHHGVIEYLRTSNEGTCFDSAISDVISSLDTQFKLVFGYQHGN